MSDKVHLPEDIGDTPAKAGAKSITQSYPFILASDRLVGYASVLAPTNDAERLNPIFKPASDNTTDVFALSRQIESQVLFRNVSNYDIEPSQWSFQASDTTAGGALAQNSESIVWSERINARASYPGAVTEVKFVPNQSAIQLRNYPVDSNIGYQQTVLYSNRVFNAGTNPILVTVAVSMTLSDNPNCSKTWGLFSALSGYFFRIYGTGAVNNFVVGYRNTLGGSTNDVEIKRNDFNGDKLNGTSGHTQAFTNVGMYGIEIGTTGYGARFWAYVTVGGAARWVLVHSLYNDSDSSQDRITDEEGLPISFEVKNIGQSTTLQTLSKYGTSVTSLGSVIGSSDISSISASKLVSPSRSPFPIIGIRASDFINSKRNFNSVLGAKLNVSVGSGTWRIVLIKNDIVGVLDWKKIDNLSAIQYDNDRAFFVTGGTQIAQFLVSQSKPLSINLKDIFALNKNFLAAQYTNDAQPSGDFGQQFLVNSDRLWICAIDANIAYANNEIIWDGSNSFNTLFTIIWDDSNSVNSLPSYPSEISPSSNIATTINASINTLEV